MKSVTETLEEYEYRLAAMSDCELLNELRERRNAYAKPSLELAVLEIVFEGEMRTDGRIR